jgi:hypothetical protein
MRTIMLGLGFVAVTLAIAVATGAPSDETYDRKPRSQNSVVEQKPFSGVNWDDAADADRG